MATKRITITLPEDLLDELQANALDNKVSLSEEICSTLKELKDKEVLTIMANAFLDRNTTAATNKLEEQTVALEVAAKNTKLAVMSAITAQTKLVTDLINEKIKPVGVVLPDNCADSTSPTSNDDDFIEWHEDIFESAIRLINRYLLLINDHNYTISVADTEQIVHLIGNSTVKSSMLL